MNYWVWFLPVFLFTLLVDIFVKFVFYLAGRRPNLRGLTGLDIVELYKRLRGIDLKVEVQSSWLGDYYDPLSDKVVLSPKVAKTPTVLSVAVSAHELGHVEQELEGYSLFKLRLNAAGILNLTTQAGYLFLILGLMFNFIQLATLGLIFFSGALLYSLITLPIEFNASARALKFIKENNLLEPSELSLAKLTLMAVALTYVAAFIASLFQFLYYLFQVLALRRDND